MNRYSLQLLKCSKLQNIDKYKLKNEVIIITKHITLNCTSYLSSFSSIGIEYATISMTATSRKKYADFMADVVSLTSWTTSTE